jgi:hypothetical protein
VGRCQDDKCAGCRDFEPHEHPERLTRPLPSRKSIIWACAHGDITFANPDFIRRVITRTHQHSDREFYFQSKNPVCFNQYLGDFSRGNTILLTTIETNRDDGYRAVSKAPLPSERYAAFRDLEWSRKIVTVEPILDFDPDILGSWLTSIRPEAVWLGYNSKPKGMQLPEPSMEKTKGFVEQLERAGIVVRLKKMRG